MTTFTEETRDAGAGDHRPLPGGPVALGAAAAAAPGAVRGGLRLPGRRRVLRRGAGHHQGPGRRGGDVLHHVQAPADRRLPGQRLHQHACATCSAARRSTTRSPSTWASGTTRPPPTARSRWSTPSAWPPATTAPVMTVNYDFFDNVDAEARARRGRGAARPASGRMPTRGARLCTLKEMAVQLAGFADEREGAVADGRPGEPTLRGAAAGRAARHRGAGLRPEHPDPQQGRGRQGRRRGEGRRGREAGRRRHRPRRQRPKAAGADGRRPDRHRQHART